MPDRPLARRVSRSACTFALALLLLAITPSQPVAAHPVERAAPRAVPLVPSSGTMWGAWVAPVAGQTGAQAVAAFESTTGRRLDVVHQYHAWDAAWPDSTESSWANGGRVIFGNASVRTMSGSVLTWSQIANGSQDSVIDAMAARFKAFGHLLFFSFDEEPENRYRANPGTYTLASFTAAYQRIHSRFVSAGVQNVVWVWNVTGDPGDEALYTGGLYPGDGYVDWIGWDPYNWNTCVHNYGWRTFDQIVAPFYNWLAGGNLSAASAGKPYMLAEYGSVEGSAGAKGQWFLDEASTLPSRSSIKAVVYFDENKDCNWPITTSSSSISGFSSAGLALLNRCTSVTAASTPASPQGSGTAVTVTATSTGCPDPVYRFWVQPPGGAWKVIQDYSPQNTSLWTSTGLLGTYRIEVDARNANESVAYDVVTNSSYSLIGCGSATLSASPSSPRPPGGVVTMTAAAVCPGTPAYRFWTAHNGIWRIAQDYSTSNAFAWNTAGLALGSYGLEVDVRNQGSTAAYESVANITYNIWTPPCAIPTLSASPVSPGATGATVSFIAATSGCPSPTYRFWVAQNGAWKILQDYSSSNTFTWNTAGYAAGSYGIEVDVRDAGTSVAYDHVANLIYSLIACSSAHLSTTPSSAQPHGTTITLTASSSCAGTPEYRFWVRDLSGRWTIVRDYSPSNTYSWDTGGLGLGTYGLEVDVRNQGSTAAYETVSNVSYALT